MLQGPENECGDFAETTAFERYGVKTSEKSIMHMSTGLPRPRLGRSAHRGPIKLLRGYVSKSSAALNPLTIKKLACELIMRGRPVADGVAWPIPSISSAHAHYAYNSTTHAYTCIACV